MGNSPFQMDKKGVVQTDSLGGNQVETGLPHFETPSGEPETGRNIGRNSRRSGHVFEGTTFDTPWIPRKQRNPMDTPMPAVPHDGSKSDKTP